LTLIFDPNRLEALWFKNGSIYQKPKICIGSINGSRKYRLGNFVHSVLDFTEVKSAVFGL